MSGQFVRLSKDKHGDTFLMWGRETFYSEARSLRTWPTDADALAWLADNYPELILEKQDEGEAQIRGKRSSQIPFNMV